MNLQLTPRHFRRWGGLMPTQEKKHLQKVQLDREKYGGGMVLVIVLVRRVNYGKHK